MKPVFFFFLSGLILAVFPIQAQQKTNADIPPYPQDFFRNPLDIPIFLAGNFGECRPGHFHSGMDIKTLGKENEPVHAAADGYISRIKMEKGGFGHGLYITHSNGYTTLYAHLNNFAPAIQKYVHNEQYDKKRWDVDLQLSPSQFPVKKGQLIAYSGNTGASTAPHLHFEIRDNKTEHPLNPELFGLPLIDKIPPAPYDIAVYDLGTSIYEQTPLIVSVKKYGEKYNLVKTKNKILNITGDTIFVKTTNPGIGFNADDFMEGSDNTITFLSANLYLDGVFKTGVFLDNIGYDETRYINAYTDYKTRQQTGKWFQCLFKLPGNHLDNIYRFDYTFSNIINGALKLDDNRAHEIKITLTDDRNNTSNIVFYLKAFNGVVPPLASAGTEFKVGQPNAFNNDKISFTLDERQLYDNIWFQYASTPDSDAYSDRYQVHYPYVPVHHFFDLQIKTGKPIPEGLEGKVVMMYSDGKDEDGRAAKPAENGFYKAGVRNFGTYWLDIDTIPPVIKSLQKSGANLAKASQITFEVKDATTSVKSFSGYLDGKWICFEAHSNLIFYKFDDHCPKGKHVLEFKATDENGNTASYKLQFTR